MIVDSNYLPSKSWSFEKEARFVNQSICIWWSHLSFADKVCRQRHQRQFDDFSWRFFRKCREFCSILEISDNITCFSNRISHQNSPRCIEKFNYHMLFLISTADLTIFWWFFWRKWRQFCSGECAATDGIFRICAARRHPRKIQANGSLRRSLRLFGIIQLLILFGILWYFLILNTN